MRKRLTREESREQTKNLLIDAARQLIAKKGLAATSVEDIVVAAGYTRGAFYSNFGSKFDLFIEIVRRDHLKTHARFATLRDETAAYEQVVARLRDMYIQQYRNDESFLNWAEARMLAARDPEFCARLGDADAEKLRDIDALVEHVYQRAGVELPAPASLMAMGFVGLFEGVKLAMLSSPEETTPKDAECILSVFLESVIHPSKAEVPAG